MYFLDSLREKDGSEIYRTKAGFRYPLSKDRSGNYKVKSGEMLRVWNLVRQNKMKKGFFCFPSVKTFEMDCQTGSAVGRGEVA